MKIRLIKIEGFRGILKPLEIHCGGGFTVICGPNGSGKSTICDVVEFALTGTLGRFGEETERREYISDYIWWRGAPAPNDRSIRVEFVDEKNEFYSVERTPKLEPESTVVERLSDPVSAPEDWRAQLCLTSIIRAETIADLSTDRPERERYDFALRAIGLAGSVAVERKLEAMDRHLKSLLSEAEASYERERSRVESWTSELSQARASVTKASEENISRLRELYADELGPARGDLNELARVLAQRVSSLRTRIDSLRSLKTAREDFEKKAVQVQTKEYEAGLRALRADLSALEERVKAAMQKRDALQRVVHEQRGRHPRLTSLALLREQGGQLGLLEGRCPLCGSTVSRVDFEKHLAAIDKEIEQTNQALGAAVRAENEASLELHSLQRHMDEVRRRYEESARLGDTLKREEAQFFEEAAHLQVALEGGALLREIEKNSQEIASLNENLAVVEAFVRIHRVTELEELLKGAQKVADEAERKVSSISRVRAAVSEAQAAARRVSGEIVRERLASLKPSFLELYERLRPHAEWAEIDLLLRGDVRPFLSMVVGDGLNPRFLFSVGQRRALGLAFLLAVHLSTSWSKLNALILDDPVQHVDDYRALHLVETLAALRMSGRQIICTVEDPALADLLCRRLRSAPDAEGVRIDLYYLPGEGVVIRDMRTISPMRVGVLAAA